MHQVFVVAHRLSSCGTWAFFLSIPQLYELSRGESSFCLPWDVCQEDSGVLTWEPVLWLSWTLRVECDPFSMCSLGQLFGQEWNLRSSWWGSCQQIHWMGSGSAGAKCMFWRRSACSLSEFQSRDSPPASSSMEGYCQPGQRQTAVTGECFTSQTPTSAASTTEAVSRSVWTLWAATNASATLGTSSTGIKRTVWVRVPAAEAQSSPAVLSTPHWTRRVPASPWLNSPALSCSSPSLKVQKQEILCRLFGVSFCASA